MENKTNFGFTLEFKNKCVSVIFNDGENSKWTSIDANDAPAFCNVLSQLLLDEGGKPYFKVMEPGLYLHQTLDEILDGLGTDNGGYLITNKAQEWLDAGKITYRGELQDHSLYRLHYGGSTIDVPYIAYVENFPKPQAWQDASGKWHKGAEEAYKRHNRNAHTKISNLEKLFKARAKGVNVNVLFTDKSQPRYALMASHWTMYLNGEFEKLAADIQARIDEAELYEADAWVENKYHQAEEEGVTVVPNSKFVLKFVEAGKEPVTAEFKNFVGKTVCFAKGKNVLNASMPINTELDWNKLNMKAQRGNFMITLANIPANYIPHAE